MIQKRGRAGEKRQQSSMAAGFATFAIISPRVLANASFNRDVTVLSVIACDRFK